MFSYEIWNLKWNYFYFSSLGIQFPFFSSSSSGLYTQRCSCMEIILMRFSSRKAQNGFLVFFDKNIVFVWYKLGVRQKNHGLVKGRKIGTERSWVQIPVPGLRWNVIKSIPLKKKERNKGGQKDPPIKYSKILIFCGFVI